MTEDWTYNRERVHLSLAGSGDPWSVFTSLRKQILRVLHDYPELDHVSRIIGKPEDEIKREIEPLIEASLAYKENNLYRPSFLVTNEKETALVVSQADRIGSYLADKLLDQWETIIADINSLEVMERYHINDIAFFLVGGRLLDIGLLEALSTTTDLMPQAPPRPSPDRPDAHYYFYMVEGEHENLGKYGQDETKLLQTGWYYITFGRNVIDDIPNQPRADLDKKCSEILNTHNNISPDQLGVKLKIPVFNPSDAETWTNAAARYSSELLGVYGDYQKELLDLHSTLKSGEYAPNSIGEFVCWFAHVAYCSAIDTLVSAGVMKIPEHRFQAAIWYREREGEGLLYGMSKHNP